MIFDRILDLEGSKISEDSWKVEAMGYMMLTSKEGNMQRASLAPMDKHRYTAAIKEEFKKFLRRNRKVYAKASLSCAPPLALPQNPSEFMGASPDRFKAVFPDDPPALRLTGPCGMPLPEHMQACHESVACATAELNSPLRHAAFRTQVHVCAQWPPRCKIN